MAYFIVVYQKFSSMMRDIALGVIGCISCIVVAHWNCDYRKDRVSHENIGEGIANCAFKLSSCIVYTFSAGKACTVVRVRPNESPSTQFDNGLAV